MTEDEIESLLRDLWDSEVEPRLAVFSRDDFCSAAARAIAEKTPAPVAMANRIGELSTEIETLRRRKELCEETGSRLLIEIERLRARVAELEITAHVPRVLGVPVDESSQRPSSPSS